MPMNDTHGRVKLGVMVQEKVRHALIKLVKKHGKTLSEVTDETLCGALGIKPLKAGSIRPGRPLVELAKK